MQTKPKKAIFIILLALTASYAVADLELGVDTEYPRHLDFKIPVKENSDFAIRASFGQGEFFSVTGHVNPVTGLGTDRSIILTYNPVTGLSTNRYISLTYGYAYSLGKSQGSATGSQSSPLDDKFPVQVVASIWSANPCFIVREVAPPISPDTRFTNATALTNLPIFYSTNSTKKTKPAAKSVDSKP